jgi:hypothetical protein
MERLARYCLLDFLCALIAGSCIPNGSTSIPVATLPESTSAPSQILFDDFSYSTTDEMIASGWIVHSGSGWPGVSGATFRPENVSFVDYPD